MKKLILIITCILILLSCEKKKKDNVIIKSIIVNEMLEKVLKKQLEFGEPGIDNPYEYSSVDLNAIIPEIKKILQSNNMKFLDKENFNKRIKLIFNRTIDSNSDSKYLYINFLG